MSAAELSVGLRLDGVTRSHVRDALWAEHALVKTFGPRGTVHLLPARDLAMWCGALSALPTGRSGHEEAAFTPEETEQLVAAMAQVLAEGELTSEELTAALVDTVGTWARDPLISGFQQDWPRWRLALYPAANRGLLCFGPARGRHVTYTSPVRWLPSLQALDAAAGVAGLVRAYLHAYGPSTPQWFARWLAAPPAWAAEAFAAQGHALEPVDLDGTPAWVVAATSPLRTLRRRACGCCRTSTPTESPASRASGSSRAGPPSVPSPAARQATTRCC